MRPREIFPTSGVINNTYYMSQSGIWRDISRAGGQGLGLFSQSKTERGIDLILALHHCEQCNGIFNFYQGVRSSRQQERRE